MWNSQASQREKHGGCASGDMLRFEVGILMSGLRVTSLLPGDNGRAAARTRA